MSVYNPSILPQIQSTHMSITFHMITIFHLPCILLKVSTRTPRIMSMYFQNINFIIIDMVNEDIETCSGNVVS